MSITICFIDNFYLGQPSGLFDSIKDISIFEKNGIEIVDSISKSKWIICSKMSCEIEHSKRNVIICEKYDSTYVGTSSHIYNHDKVKAIFKCYLPRDKKMLNEPTVLKRLHYKKISDKCNLSQKENILKIDNNNIDKFKLVHWDLRLSHLNFDKTMSLCQNFKKDEKPIDIFCVLHKHTGLLAKYRQLVVDKVNKLKEKGYKVYCGINIASKKEYHEAISKSKICISCYGLGERISMDEKAILTGAVLVKPDSDYVNSVPDIYRDEYYTKVNVNYSDLEEKIEDIMNNYDLYHNKTLKAQKLLMSYDKKKYIEYFCDKLKEIIL